MWLKATPTNRIERSIIERPLLHVCSGNDKDFGDVALDWDAETKPDILANCTILPFRDNSFMAVFADVPWSAAWKTDCARLIRESLRVAPFVYILSPWIYGSKEVFIDSVQVLWNPGVNNTLSFVRYVRRCIAI